jgi:hypothetical protein
MSEILAVIKATEGGDKCKARGRARLKPVLSTIEDVAEQAARPATG